MPRQYFAPLALGTLVAALFFVIVLTLGSGGDGKGTTATTTTAARRLPLYWNVKRGQTYAQIAERTGLSIDELETFNPQVDPNSLQAGTKLKLTLNIPKPKPKRLGPRYYTARAGDSFGSIAAKTHHSITKLQTLNGEILPDKLQPGDRIQLRE